MLDVGIAHCILRDVLPERSSCGAFKASPKMSYGIGQPQKTSGHVACVNNLRKETRHPLLAASKVGRWSGQYFST